MNLVKAYQIDDVRYTGVSDWLKGMVYDKGIHGKEYGWFVCIDMDFIDAKVGDWVVVWPSGARITYSAEGFAKHFRHIHENTYETPWTPLFNAQRYSRPIVN